MPDKPTRPYGFTYDDLDYQIIWCRCRGSTNTPVTNFKETHAFPLQSLKLDWVSPLIEDPPQCNSTTRQINRFEIHQFTLSYLFQNQMIFWISLEPSTRCSKGSSLSQTVQKWERSEKYYHKGCLNDWLTY